MGKFWIISDTHFGVRNNSKKWETLMTDWMDDFFFPLIDSEICSDDVLIHLGDVFDNRQSVCLSTMSMAIDFFEKAASRFKQVWVLCGNHDAYYTTKNDITSIDCLKHIPGVNIVKTQTIQKLFGKHVLFIPWTEDKNVFKNIKKESADIMFCHAEFYGCVMNSSGTLSEHDFSIPDISHIYSGHIHHRHKHKNVTYVGSPYQLTQNDRNNSKSVWTFDPHKDEEHIYYNTFSPEFIKMKYTDIDSMTFGEFKRMCDNKFVEIETDANLMSKCRFPKLLSLIQENKNIRDVKFSHKKTVDKKTEHINISECTSLTEMLETYINSSAKYDETTKKSVLAISKKLINGQ